MQRKNNSKATIEKIISAAAKLFAEKGYDDTSIQNIVDSVGMSKGAIFHHFKSKEDIFYAVIDDQTQNSKNITKRWLSKNKHLTGKQKLTALLFENAKSIEIHSLDTPIVEQMSNPKMIVTMMQIDINQNSTLVADLIKEGNADGSLCVESPEECAEVFLLLINTWCNEILFPCDIEKFKARQYFLQKLMCQAGLDIVTEELIQLQTEFSQNSHSTDIK